MRYKKILSEIASYDMPGIMHKYSALYQLRESNHYYELIFNRQFNSPVLIPKITDKQVKYSAFFYLDDDNVLLDLRQMLIIAIVDRLKSYQEGNFKFIQQKHLKNDISFCMKSIVNVEPTSLNNMLKIQNRIRVIKTYKIDEGQKIYFASIGEALRDYNIPDSQEDIKKYSLLFNDPIKVDSLTEGVYCWLQGNEYQAAGYHSDKTSITSIFEKKSNLPERLRQHYTSNFLESKLAQFDYLTGNYTSEKTNALCIFVPVTSAKEKPFGNRNPLGKDTLLSGEILITKSLADRDYYVRRTFQTDSLDVDICSVGSILQPGDVIAYDIEGFPALIYDLNYKDAVVEDVIQLWNCYKIILKIVAPAGEARIISEYGVKGVTHPREDLGLIALPDSLNESEMPVEMIIGPNSLKSGENGIRMAWLNLKCILNDSTIQFKPGEISENTINELTSDIQKVDWFYKGEVYQVYCGVMSFGVTDLAKDCRSKGVTILPETLKYMYMSQREELAKVADLLLQNYIETEDKWVLHELLRLKKIHPDQDEVPIINWDDDRIKNIGYFNVTNWISSKRGTKDNIFLLNPFNNGFYVRINDSFYIRFPSSQLIETLTFYGQGTVTYPQFLTHAMLLLMGIKQVAIGKTNDFGRVMENYERYIHYVDYQLFTKKMGLSLCVSPWIEGGNLKQLVSCYVPRGVTVILDGKLTKQINDFYKTYKKQIYEIGVRNPVIWRSQFYPRKVWTYAKFEKYLIKKGIDINEVILPEYAEGSVLRNILDTLFDKSDTDGDLYPIAVPLNEEIQIALHSYMSNPEKIKDYEKEWIENYIKDELSKNRKFENIENKQFQFHTVDREWFADTMSNAAIAKAKIGIATVDLWRFHSMAEWRMHFGEITFDQMAKIQFYFSRIVQDTVVEGVKHIDGGSSGYNVFELATINENVDIIRTILKDNLQLDNDLINIFIDTALMSQDHKMSKAISRLPSGGRSSSIANLLKVVPEIPGECLESLSYAKIIKPYWQPLLSVAYSNREDYAEYIESITDSSVLDVEY